MTPEPAVATNIVVRLAERVIESIPGPLVGTRITEGYARMVARDAFFWAWPMVNVYNRRMAFKKATRPALMNGVFPIAPINHLSMLHDFIDPSERWIACPNHDVVYGAGVAALDESPVVVQVPDFGRRFWMYQIVDLRTDSFADVGVMYGTKPGFYLLVGPGWKSDPPKGITRVFKAKTNTALVVPSVLQEHSPEDNQAVQWVIALIDMYPLSKFNGQMKQQNWGQLPKLGGLTREDGARETRWVFPERFFDELPNVLADAPPLPGEEARYIEVLALIAAAQRDPVLKRAMIDEAFMAEKELIDPLQQFRNFGTVLPFNWTTESNGAQFGTDYFMRTAIARSNILVNRPNETTYFYQDLDVDGARLNGARYYTITFAAGQRPPVKGFWSLTLYDRQHFLVPNALGRYSVGTKSTNLKPNADGSLTIYVQANEPQDPVRRTNWLPAPNDDFSLYLRAYWPDAAIIGGQWTPPAVIPRA